jgi:general secretion pathway protein I
MQGYTLIEVLVAFTILALALTVLFRIFSAGLRNVDASAEYALAVLVAEGKLAEAGISTPLRTSISEGLEADVFNWSRSIVEYEPASAALENPTSVHAYRITVHVEWPARRGIRQIELQTIRLSTASTTAGRF